MVIFVGTNSYCIVAEDNNDGPAPASPPEDDRESSSEPALRLPTKSAGGQAVLNGPLDAAHRQDEIKSLVDEGSLWTSSRGEKIQVCHMGFVADHTTVPIYDLVEALNGDNLPSCNQESLSGATDWEGGNVPANSYVCVHFVPARYTHGKHVDVQFQLLRVVVLGTPMN